MEAIFNSVRVQRIRICVCSGGLGSKMEAIFDPVVILDKIVQIVLCARLFNPWVGHSLLRTIMSGTTCSTGRWGTNCSQVL